jgi:Ser/Thr protein kinase RdoA (MazF antagonist)
VRSTGGEIVATIDGARWRVFEWIELVGPPPLIRAGETLARLHTIDWPATEAIDPWYTRRTFGGSWEQLLERARDQPWAPLLRAQVPELAALDAIPAGATLPPCRMCHRDFNEANVSLDRSGRVVVLDWDNCGPLAPEWEVGYVLADGGRGQWFLDKEAGWREFIAGYLGAGGVFEPRGLEVFGTAIAARHNFLAETILASLRGDAWARETAGAILAHPLTLGYLRRALDAVA